MFIEFWNVQNLDNSNSDAIAFHWNDSHNDWLKYVGYSTPYLLPRPNAIIFFIFLVSSSLSAFVIRIWNVIQLITITITIILTIKAWIYLYEVHRSSILRRMETMYVKWMKAKPVEHSKKYWTLTVAISISKEILLIRFDLMLRRRWSDMIAPCYCDVMQGNMKKKKRSHSNQIMFCEYKYKSCWLARSLISEKSRQLCRRAFRHIQHVLGMTASTFETGLISCSRDRLHLDVLTSFLHSCRKSGTHPFFSAHFDLDKNITECLFRDRWWELHASLETYENVEIFG